jgi:hypothetical protein
MVWFFIAYACIFLIVLALVVLILWESRPPRGLSLSRPTPLEPLPDPESPHYGIGTHRNKHLS